jgi:ferritin-like metal-binding protein YciE
MKMTTLDEVLADELKDIYSAENQLIKALPKMAKAAESDDLRKAFEKHLEQTRVHAQRIEEICSDLSTKPRGKRCVGMEGLIEEGKEIMQQDVEPDVLDAALIGAAQRVEHYEIAGYGCARTYAKMLGRSGQAALLQRTLEEEGETDHRLTALAETVVNVDALKA